ncbi:hypothetical protein BT63DRAFT_410014 [Microthyrium microscopicum]|uniref:Uncharacterized protein n=1 Tax=Microthyrium microscopicum TaxID=703497 RepID=A0A6A6UL14_9PEZI|nr:hypothetical protein BT63DRAFT_410014 [Microthyrium microscopicum]
MADSRPMSREECMELVHLTLVSANQLVTVMPNDTEPSMSVLSYNMDAIADMVDYFIHQRHEKSSQGSSGPSAEFKPATPGSTASTIDPSPNSVLDNTITFGHPQVDQIPSTTLTASPNMQHPFSQSHWDTTSVIGHLATSEGDDSFDQFLQPTILPPFQIFAHGGASNHSSGQMMPSMAIDRNPRATLPHPAGPSPALPANTNAPTLVVNGNVANSQISTAQNQRVHHRAAAPSIPVIRQTPAQLPEQAAIGLTVQVMVPDPSTWELKDGSVKALSCPLCGGNGRQTGQWNWAQGVKGLAEHVRMSHYQIHGRKVRIDYAWLLRCGAAVAV